ncbi:4-hydroxyphenylacetate 3-hydroxylase N-terminal domain-containing protein [Sulfolobus acidocaldarius]|uniref:Hydroxylase n=4 Tax=Sulfolobus acidocaldarius TaxID=2285 RepID=Q4J9S5_SULAC|nr:4-hydroxyphenylacetate 3-hydroxylase N-terminal domain-containing protein [Sulfolobus acidocaldarius]AAY80455.1 hydroxylase [Sulfolobus acidocaldarius DSM 639]AGE71040.1 hydroxylase [Sulfolobus acidocaldarius N8]AGE73311.1 hydroxylase [Sulfolobus acidocaldarius Ron12/I]ALU28669.1 4-hydroxybutyryl-CoA dehydratase [Sulfolobus acidocaldarius]ALU31385.1 4-hydroxybutyryl-CoA dehydratase [Sulfolobus acidocaldarius]
MRTKGDFLKSLRDGRKVFYRGKPVEDITAHPILSIAAIHASKLFEYSDRMYEDPSLGKVSKFFKKPTSTQDLLERHKLIYDTTMYCNGIFNISQAIGSDAIFALTITARQLDRKYGTDYTKRIQKYHEYVTKNDLTIATAQTDVKGDRSKRPSEQADPDMYVRIVDVKSDGIVVRGAKAHTTQSAVSDEIIVIPTRAMKDSDKDYAVAFAVPANAPGLKLYVRPIDEIEGNTSAVLSKKDYELETITVFDNVFVPWDRVFLFKEYDYAGNIAMLFATYHRFTALSYRSALINLFLGSARVMAKANGIENEKHVRDDVVDLILYKEILRSTAITSAISPVMLEGVAVPNPLYVNVGKLYSNMHFHDVIKDLVDVAGGIIATLPSQEDFDSEEGKTIIKYLRGAVDGEERVKILKLVKELAASPVAGYLLTAMVHAEGSIEASKIELFRSYDYREAESLIKKIIG